MNPYDNCTFPTNQKEAVLAHIQKHGEIDFLAAANKCGISQLTARISELRCNGWRFDKRTEVGKNRYGHTFSKAIYSNARREEKKNYTFTGI